MNSKKDLFLNEYFNHNKKYGYSSFKHRVNLGFLSNIIFDIDNNKIPLESDILYFIDALSMKDSTKLITLYIKILEKGFNSVETLKLKFFIQKLLKEQLKNTKYYEHMYKKPSDLIDIRFYDFFNIEYNPLK